MEHWDHNDLNERGAQGLKSMGEEKDNRTQVKHMMLIKMRETKCGNIKRKDREAQNIQNKTNNTSKLMQSQDTTGTMG